MTDNHQDEVSATIEDSETVADTSSSPRLFYYADRLQEFSAAQTTLETRLSRLSNARLMSAILAIGGLVGIAVVGATVWPLVITIVGAMLFVVLVIAYRSTASQLARTEAASDFHTEARAKLNRNWNEVPLQHNIETVSDHPYAGDLDIVGFGSLMHLVDGVSTSMGESALRKWLLDRSSPDDIQQRQPAIEELAAEADWREELSVLGRLGSDDRSDPAEFLDWANSEPTLQQRPWLIWAARAGLLASIVAIVLAIIGVIAPALIVAPLLVNLLLFFSSRAVVADTIDIAASESKIIGSYGAMIQHLDTTIYQTPWLKKMSANLSSETGKQAHDEINSLDRLTSWAVPTGSLSHLPLQALVNWDLHLLWALERWQARSGNRVAGWFETLGQFEALSSLAQLTFDNPNWTMPDVAMSHDRVAAQSIGHPLLPDSQRVVNDVEMGPAGTVLLITGSNMSGKSTLLRTIGINMVLAQAGASCCATSLSMPPAELWSSVRVSDSLEQGISYYMAELIRLKQIHSAAEVAHAEKRPFAYLLDEILHGTNTSERQIAARHVVNALVELGAIGAVSTHDLGLAESGRLRQISHLVHFADQVSDNGDGPGMTFDYLLKPGVATSTNALKLMEMVGFELPQEVTKPS